MPELPQTWCEAPLDLLISRIDSGLNVKCEERPPQSGEKGIVKISAVTWGRFNEEESKTFPADIMPKESSRIISGDLLFSRANTLELVGASVIVGTLDKELYLSDKVLRLVVSEDSKRWVNYALKTPAIRKSIEDASSGNQLSMRNIAQEKLKAIKIPLPPLAEQKQIAAKLDELLAQVDTIKARLDAIPKIIKRFRQSVLAAAVSGRLTEEWRAGSNAEQGARQAAPLQNPVRATYSGRSKQRPYEIQSVPPVGAPLAAPLHGSEQTKTIGDICIASFDGPFGSKLKSDDYTEAGVRVVRLENINHLQFVDEKQTFISLEKYETLLKNTLLTHDVLFSSFVDEEVRVCLLPKSKEIFINKADCFCLRVDESKALPKFVAYALSSRHTYDRVKKQVHGATRPRINLGTLKAFEINVPPLEEQTEIVRRVEQLFAFADQIETRVKDATARVNHLTQSILAKAFRGELTADWRAQNPELISGENSAEALLARIRAERENTGRAKKSRQPA